MHKILSLRFEVYVSHINFMQNYSRMDGLSVNFYISWKSVATPPYVGSECNNDDGFYLQSVILKFT